MDKSNSNFKENILLKDSPVNIDELGCHDEIANTISKIIEGNNNTDIDRVVGLFGEWGSGKSTIINILKNKDKFKVFTFSSWLHKDDFLNRAFLLEFCKEFGTCDEEYINRRDYIDDEDKITFQDYIANKININRSLPIPWNTKTKLIFSLIFILLYFIPLSSNFNNIEVSLPFIIIILLLIIFTGVNSSEKFFIPFITKKINIDNNLTTKSFDFTNYNFQEVFIKIIQCYKEKENKTIIIALEDFDRLSSENMPKALNLLQILSNLAKEEKRINKKFWIILPIDNNKLSSMLKLLYPEINNNEENNIKQNYSVQHLGLPQGISTSQISTQHQNLSLIDYQKRLIPFSIFIPDIDLTNWGNFFKQKFNEIFNDINENELNNIIDIFDAVFTDTNEKLTPRFIISYINELKINYIFWKNKTDLIEGEKKYIKIEYQALYIALNVLKKDLIESESIINPNATEINKYISSGLYGSNNIEIFKSLLIQKYKTIKINYILQKDYFISDITNGNTDVWAKINNTLFKDLNISKEYDNKKKNIIRRCINKIINEYRNDASYIINLGNVLYVLQDIETIDGVERDLLSQWKKDFTGLCIPYLKYFINNGNAAYIRDLTEPINLKALESVGIIIKEYDLREARERLKDHADASIEIAPEPIKNMIRSMVNKYINI
ncbi:MAG: P-loop NTPase fold protein [bacterium]